MLIETIHGRSLIALGDALGMKICHLDYDIRVKHNPRSRCSSQLTRGLKNMGSMNWWINRFCIPKTMTCFYWVTWHHWTTLPVGSEVFNHITSNVKESFTGVSTWHQDQRLSKKKLSPTFSYESHNKEYINRHYHELTDIRFTKS